VKHALEWVSKQTAPPAAPVAETPSKNMRLWQGAAAVLGLMALGLAGWMFWPKKVPPAPVTRFQISLPDNVNFGQYVSLSPDGRKLVVNTAGTDGLWIRDLGTLEWRRLPGTEGASSPFWSPDSRYLAFAVQNQLKKIEISGGPVQTLCSLPAGTPAGSGAWNQDGEIVFGGRGGEALCGGFRKPVAFRPLSPPSTSTALKRSTRCRFLCLMGSTLLTCARERPKQQVSTADLWMPNRQGIRGSAFWQANSVRYTRTSTSSSCAKTR